MSRMYEALTMRGLLLKSSGCCPRVSPNREKSSSIATPFPRMAVHSAKDAWLWPAMGTWSIGSWRSPWPDSESGAEAVEPTGLVWGKLASARARTCTGARRKGRTVHEGVEAEGCQLFCDAELWRQQEGEVVEGFLRKLPQNLRAEKRKRSVRPQSHDDTVECRGTKLREKEKARAPYHRQT